MEIEELVQLFRAMSSNPSQKHRGDVESGALDSSTAL